MIDTLVSHAAAIKHELARLGFAIPPQTHIETHKLKQIHTDFCHCATEVVGQSEGTLYRNVQLLVSTIHGSYIRVHNLDDVLVATSRLLCYLKQYNG